MRNHECHETRTRQADCAKCTERLKCPTACQLSGYCPKKENVPRADSLIRSAHDAGFLFSVHTN